MTRILRSLIAVAICILAVISVTNIKSRKSTGNHPEINTIPVWEKDSARLSNDTRITTYVLPSRIVWKQSTKGSVMKNEEVLLKNAYGQAVLGGISLCHMVNSKDGMNSLLLDFGRELHGGLQLVTGSSKSRTVKVRVRFGESAEEAMCEIDGVNGATNDHAMRDFTVELPWLGITEVGCSGYRFARIDLLGAETDLLLQEVRASFRHHDIPFVGSFECNDQRLNDIWQTGAYTVYLNMQQFLWDGIKRDRLVWTGDINPEILTIASVFGKNDIVNKSLDLSKECFAPDKWMCSISSYSIWWLITHYQWYMHTGDRDYLDQQKDYTDALLENLLKYVDEDGHETLPARFLDWPSSTNQKGVDSGLQALMAIGMEAGAKLEQIWGNDTLADRCSATAEKLKESKRDFNGSKQAAALNSIAGMASPDEASTGTILPGGAEGFSTFYGYYMLEALALSNHYSQAMDLISEYWGAMLDLGATTFWEDFDISWTANAARIDDLVPEGKIDVHRTYGDYCYKGYRHSLCHGWASGPTVWLSSHVLGVKVLEPGCTKVAIEPHLGKLEWVKGTFPTPYGPIEISHKVGTDGKIYTEVKAPKEVKVEKSE